MVIKEYETECAICHEVDTHLTRDCPQNHCFRCKRRGHWSTQCPSIKCHVCGELGHKARMCQKQCEICFKTGHKTENCRHKDSGVTFIQNPMKRARDESPGMMAGPEKVQKKRPEKRAKASKDQKRESDSPKEVA